jgi:hypothetical protein
MSVAVRPVNRIVIAHKLVIELHLSTPGFCAGFSTTD